MNPQLSQNLIIIARILIPFAIAYQFVVHIYTIFSHTMNVITFPELLINIITIYSILGAGNMFFTSFVRRYIPSTTRQLIDKQFGTYFALGVAFFMLLKIAGFSFLF